MSGMKALAGTVHAADVLVLRAPRSRLGRKRPA